jgi:hypothetical protein
MFVKKLFNYVFYIKYGKKYLGTILINYTIKIVFKLKLRKKHY